MTRHNGQRAPEEIQADIERTRLDLDQTLSALESRLTPGQFMDQGLAYLRRSGARQYVERLGESAKQDPIPLALVGISLAWLMMSDRGRGRSAEAGSDTGLTASMKDTAASMKGAASSMKEGVDETSGKLSDTAHAMRQRAGRVADSARERAAQVADTARQQADRVRGGYDYLVTEQPLALGAVGLAIGAVLAAVAPRTRQEDRVLGPAKERVQNDLQQAARDTFDDAARAVSAGTDAAVETLRTAPGADTEAASQPAAEWQEPGDPKADGEARPYAAPPVPPDPS